MSELSHRAPTDWKTDAMQKRIRKRYRAERRFRLIGMSAVVISAAFLFFLLATMIGNGAAGFMRTEVSLPIDFKSAPLEVDRTQLATRGADLALAGAGLEDRVQNAATAAFGEKGEELIAENAWTAVRDAIKEDPNLLSQSTHIWVPASSELDAAADGVGEPEFRTIVRQLRERGALQSGFNASFLSRADSTDPTAVGIWGALKGSMLTMLVTLLIAFPIGVLSAVYLEEYALSLIHI